MILKHNRISNFISVYDEDKLKGYVYAKNNISTDRDELLFSNLIQVGDDKYQCYLVKRDNYNRIEYYRLTISESYDNTNGLNKYTIIHTEDFICNKSFICYDDWKRKKYNYYIFMNEILIEYNVTSLGVRGNIHFGKRFKYKFFKPFRYKIEYISGYYIKIGKKTYGVDIEYGLKEIIDNTEILNVENLPLINEYQGGLYSDEPKLDNTLITKNDNKILLEKKDDYIVPSHYTYSHSKYINDNIIIPNEENEKEYSSTNNSEFLSLIDTVNSQITRNNDIERLKQITTIKLSMRELEDKLNKNEIPYEKYKTYIKQHEQMIQKLKDGLV